MEARTDRLHFTGDEEADRLLVEDPLALLIGFVLDQQVTLQKAFSGPLELKRRLGALDAAQIASMDASELEEVFAARPALHRFPRNMARRTRELCAVIVSAYGGDAGRIWSDAKDGNDLRRRLSALPGFGDMKVRTLTAVLGKRLGIRPPGWEALLPPQMSLGDVDSPETLSQYQTSKRAMKAATRGGQAP